MSDKLETKSNKCLYMRYIVSVYVDLLLQSRIAKLSDVEFLEWIPCKG